MFNEFHSKLHSHLVNFVNEFSFINIFSLLKKFSGLISEEFVRFSNISTLKIMLAWGRVNQFIRKLRKETSLISCTIKLLIYFVRNINFELQELCCECYK